MHIRLVKYPIISLVIIALLSGILWRIELEYHGWAGLTWLSYFHYAVPAAYGLFMLWANLIMQLSWNKRIALNITSIMYGVLIYYSLGVSLTYFFNRGPSGFIMSMATPQWEFNLFRYSIFALIPIIPSGTFLILKQFGYKVSLKILLCSIACTFISIPLSTLLLELVHHKGGHDHIHAIKSGFLMPLWVISIGLLFIANRKISPTKYETANSK